jgi:hypothetical protein
MSGIAISNRFEILCELAQREEWCWNLSCTTCGHGVFRWALKALSKGFDPITDEWPVHWGPETTFEKLQRTNGPMASRAGFPISEQRAIQSAVIGCDLHRIASTVRFPQWLGYIGVFLAYSEDAESENQEITTSLVPQLLRLVRSDSEATSILERLLAERRPLRWPHLELVEHCYLGPR